MIKLILIGALAVASMAYSSQAFAQDYPPIAPYAASNDNAGAKPFADDKLFQAFHGQEGVSRIVDVLVNRSVADPRTAEIFKAVDLTRLRVMLKEQVCYLLAGPCDYTGRDMKTAHKDMGVQNADFNALVENLQIAMDQEKVPFRAQNRLLAKLAPMQRDVVTR